MRTWTEEEVKSLRQLYPVGGCDACKERIPNKTRIAIHGKAACLGIKISQEVLTNIRSKAGKNTHQKYLIKDNKPLNWKGGISKDNMRYSKRTKAKYPEKEKARRILMFAIRSGKLIRLPCLICGNKKSEAHHTDYTKPLDVVFLCRRHHIDVHKNLISLDCRGV